MRGVAKGIWSDPEFRAKKTELARQRLASLWADPNYRARQEEALRREAAKRKGAPVSDEVKANLRLGAANRELTPELREKYRQAGMKNRGHVMSIEARANMSLGRAVASKRGIFG